MNSTNNYITNKRLRAIIFALICAVVIAIGCMIGTSECQAAGERYTTVWAMCQPGSTLIVRRSSSKNSMEVGRLDPCDPVETDGKSVNGYIHVYGNWENGDGFVYCGYLSTEEPERVFEQYVCVSRARVACRRWISGPMMPNHAWITNGTNVQVFYRTSEWSVTNRGYIKSEWLEADPQ